MNLNYEKLYIDRYNSYKNFIIQNGGRKNLIELDEINKIIWNIIKNGNPRIISEGKSTIYYKQPNADGSFDICGRMQGPIVDLVYKMELYKDDIILLKRYSKYFFDRNFLENNGIVRKKDIYINKNGHVNFDLSTEEEFYETNIYSSVLEDINNMENYKKVKILHK